jgi:hypothetical protein
MPEHAPFDNHSFFYYDIDLNPGRYNFTITTGNFCRAYVWTVISPDGGAAL